MKKKEEEEEENIKANLYPLLSLGFFKASHCYIFGPSIHLLQLSINKDTCK